MPLKPNAMCTLDEVKAELSMPPSVTDYDAILEHFINSASAYIETECSRRFIIPSTEVLTQYFSGNRQNALLLSEWPVKSIEGLWVDNLGEFGVEALIDPSFYRVQDEIAVMLMRTAFPIGFQNVKVNYKAGYPDIAALPQDLNLAAIWFAAWSYLHRTRQDIGRTNVSKGDENVSIAEAVPKEITAIIAKYRRVEAPLSPRQILV